MEFSGGRNKISEEWTTVNTWVKQTNEIRSVTKNKNFIKFYVTTHWLCISRTKELRGARARTRVGCFPRSVKGIIQILGAFKLKRKIETFKFWGKHRLAYLGVRVYRVRGNLFSQVRHFRFPFPKQTTEEGGVGHHLLCSFCKPKQNEIRFAKRSSREGGKELLEKEYRGIASTVNERASEQKPCRLWSERKYSPRKGFLFGFCTCVQCGETRRLLSCGLPTGAPPKLASLLARQVQASFLASRGC